MKPMIKKFLLSFIIFILIITALNFINHPFIFYLPVNIPGKQMAATIPPFGIFIEKGLKNEKREDPCSVYTHEMVHWQQYQRMGLFSFYYQYLKVYFKKGRFNNWMEEEARRPCNGTQNRQ
jgi:hypothetical protein